MMTTRVRLLAVLSIIMALGVMAIVATQTPAEAQHFAKNGIAFDYPSGWKLQEMNAEDTYDMVLTRANYDIQIIVTVHKGKTTQEKLPDAKKLFIDPYIKERVKQFVSMGATPQQAPDSAEIGGVKAEGVNITASLGGETGAAKVYWAIVGQRVVVLTLFGPDTDLKRFAPAWELVRTTLKIEEPKPAASPSPKP
jgi:hypothetical protein